MTTSRQTQLQRVLLLDAATCIAMALLLLLAGAPLAALLELPPRLLFYAGLLLLPTAAFMATTAIKWFDSGSAIWIVITGNWLWVMGSIMLLAGGWASPNTLGFVFIIGQAAAVAVLAGLEFRLFRSRQPQVA